MGLKDDILNADDLRLVQLSVPEWGCHIWVKTLSGTQLSHYMNEAIDLEGTKAHVKIDVMRNLLIALTLCDEKGERLFTSKEDIAALSSKSAAALSRIFEMSSNLSGLTKESLEQIAGN